MRLQKRKGQVDIAHWAIYIVMVVVVIAVGATVLSQLQSTQTANSVAYNVTGAGLTGLAPYPKLDCYQGRGVSVLPPPLPGGRLAD